ncbi:MAG: hypothetical protein A3J09_00425 [Candidatus Zambryskibacteria bacterium RIFCSPLOWO2_02_FULL_51_21]|uniref:Band 7 domain-containing protein n=1 Tax=Candidatus Zambryskibacteria bacterium RIFCSPHIGHO2_02_FULL_43_37 TaxID=1802749 RepID=A0A1G2TIM7_9BACT|nr:MAG: hypothetical protein A2723_00425 [Candidatus Zambryskibacteria bacterium RIFCSPHIGHO2_01_FULL_52_18]OHA96918.1 MAG: hypothetical protein A3D49_02325 [Candidatus Zambryskibacteria bacterium RIFCSPHIGHO2_02_FULL_43_37]OHB06699.1 MAG: hypothetical protein A2944_02515 [Candidatus Zambryskibacteria bacterium RIFCSPLOWO2_01_FULL_52_12]OHB11031.1 MAG: hypothetical protein A3J09_00425 [Candidatus Zambryskibacteria bacterium RIFCSPLOWO2_02_FULL_51_21]
MWIVLWSAALTVLVGVLFWLLRFGIPWLIVTLSKLDVWWSPFRALPPAGEMYILVSGDPDGPFDQIIESVIGYRYDRDSQIFVPDPTKRPERTGILGQLGVAKVGFFKYFLWRELRYSKWEKKPDPSTDWSLVSKVRGDKKRPENSPSIFFRYNMATKIEGAETIGNFPVDGIVVFTAELENPIKAFFYAGGWESQTTAAVQGAFREYVSRKDIQGLREDEASGANQLIAKLKGLSETSGESKGLRESFGVKIIDARFVTFDLTSGDKKMTDATRALEIAKLTALAQKEEGKGEGDKRKARAEGIREELAAWGSSPVGAQIAMAEAIKVAQPNVIGGNIVTSVDAERKK